MTKKRFLSILLVLVLVLTALTGCGNKDAGDDADQGGGDAVDSEMTIGFIYIGNKTDGGYTEAMHNGTMAMEEHFGGKVKTLIAENTKEDKQAVQDAAINMIDQGATVIIGTSFGFMDGIAELANDEKYKDIKFLHFSGNQMNETNFGNYFGAMEEPRYLSGIIAGLKTESDKIGYVAAYDYTEVLIGIDAFTLGVRSVNPDAVVNVVYVNSWNDPANEKAAAESLLAQGCDVITQHCDSAGPQLAAQDAGAFAIGYNLDNTKKAPGSFMTAPVWHHEKFLIPTIEKIMDGSWTPESYYGNMKDGYVGLAPMTDLVPAEAKTKVEEIQKQMEAGEFPVFVGPIKNNKGEVVVPEGTTLDRDGIWKIDYLVEGAVAAQ